MTLIAKPKLGGVVDHKNLRRGLRTIERRVHVSVERSMSSYVVISEETIGRLKRRT